MMYKCVVKFHPMSVTDGDIDLDDVGEVMKVLTEIGSNDVGDPKDHIVDRAALADEKLAILTARQAELEKRFAAVSRRIGALRTRTLGSHVATELGWVHKSCLSDLESNLMGRISSYLTGFASEFWSNLPSVYLNPISYPPDLTNEPSTVRFPHSLQDGHPAAALVGSVGCLRRRRRRLEGGREEAFLRAA